MLPFKFKRGPLSRLPVLSEGEPAMTNDTGSEHLYFGSSSGNIQVLNYTELTDVLGQNVLDIKEIVPANDDFIQRKSGVWTNRTVTQVRADIVDGYSQPIDADLTAIAALSPANDDFLQRKSSAWTNRTAYQANADIIDPTKIYTFFDDCDDGVGLAGMISNGRIGKFWVMATTGSIGGSQGVVTSNINRPGQYVGLTGGFLGNYVHITASAMTGDGHGVSALTPNLIFKTAFAPQLSSFPRYYCGMVSELPSGIPTNGYYFTGDPKTRNVTITTNGTTTITSSAAFLVDDIGKKVTGTGIPANTYITKYVSSSNVTISNAATDSSSASRAVDGTNTWVFICQNSSGATILDTQVALVNGTYNTLEFRISSDATSVEVFVDGVSKGTVANTFQFAGSLKVLAGVYHTSSNGIAQFSIDYVYVRAPISRL